MYGMCVPLIVRRRPLRNGYAAFSAILGIYKLLYTFVLSAYEITVLSAAVSLTVVSIKPLKSALA